MKNNPILLLTILTALLLLSCKKEKNAEETFGTYVLRLTDSPGEYEAVNIDIQDVSVHVEGTGWIDIGPQNPGIYNLLDYNNGMDTLLSNATLPSGTITQVRLVLGTNNTVVINGTSYTLAIPAAQQSGIKINVNTTITANATTIQWIDFDAGRSIVQQGNGSYQLKPVLRAFNNTNNGRIKGNVLPPDALPYVLAIQGDDTLCAIPETNGFFQFSGLSGSYQLNFIPTNTAYSTIITYNNMVTGNQLLNVGTITLP